MANIENIEKLKSKVIKNNGKLPYINLTENNTYAGWVKDFHIYNKETKETVSLDLHNENDMFCLFAMASCWSITGPWENSPSFIAYLKYNKYDNPKLWEDINFTNQEKNKIKDNIRIFNENFYINNKRKEISFRPDFFNSIHTLANNWNNIKSKLLESEKNDNYSIFINYMRSIKGLGSGNNCMKIKILLILRELRIQNIYKNIPGKWCCVPDNRVKDAVNNPNLDIKLYNGTDFKYDLKNSEIIYQYFGALYDIPLFAYEDLK